MKKLKPFYLILLITIWAISSCVYPSYYITSSPDAPKFSSRHTRDIYYPFHQKKIHYYNKEWSYHKYYENGEIVESLETNGKDTISHTIRGKKQGCWDKYYPAGKIKIVEFYKNDLLKHSYAVSFRKKITYKTKAGLNYIMYQDTFCSYKINQVGDINPLDSIFRLKITQEGKVMLIVYKSNDQLIEINYYKNEEIASVCNLDEHTIEVYSKKGKLLYASSIAKSICREPYDINLDNYCERMNELNTPQGDTLSGAFECYIPVLSN